MGFFEAIASGYTKWNDFQGRARRSEYWYWELFVWIVLIGLMMFEFAARRSSNPAVWETIGGLGILLFFPFILFPGVALLVRRLHDIGVSGWLALVYFIPYVGGLIVLIMTVLPGARGENAYGPDSRNLFPDIETVF